MKHLLNYGLFTALVLTAVMSSCSPDDPGVGPVNDGTVTLTPNKTAITADGEDAVIFTVRYGDKDVSSSAAIKMNGTAITGNTFTTTQAGTYKFIAEYDGKTSTEVTITALEHTSNLVLSVDKPEIWANGEDVVTFTVKYNAEDVTHSATIKMNGTAITGNTFTTVNTGEYKFTAVMYDGKTSNEVTVTAKGQARVLLSHITTTRPKNITFKLKAVVLPANAENKEVTWESSDTSIATVDAQTGIITTLASGISTITVTSAESGRTAECVLTVDKTCNSDTPGWGAAGLGTISFKTDKTWTVEGEEWSDAVTSSVCNTKTTFVFGPSLGNYCAECRNNPGYNGDLFTWCAVIRFQDELCPDGWRVPSMEEFQELDRSFGGTGSSRQTTIDDINATYLNPNIWGGELAGSVGRGMSGDAILSRQGRSGGYWAADQWRDGNGHNLFYTHGTPGDEFSPPTVQADSYFSFIDVGYPLRCIKTI